MSIALSEQEIIRRESLKQLRELGINPYPAEEFQVTAFAQEITAAIAPNQRHRTTEAFNREINDLVL